MAYLQAALDQEQKHARLLAALGAASRHTEFYFPAATFAELGYTSHIGSYLWVLDHLETAFISTYIAAIKQHGELGHRELAVPVARMLGVERQHRALYRVIAHDDPADNVTLEVAELSCVGDAVTLLTPFLTGRGFPGGAARAVHPPGQGHVARVVGLNTSSNCPRYGFSPLASGDSPHSDSPRGTGDEGEAHMPGPVMARWRRGRWL